MKTPDVQNLAHDASTNVTYDIRADRTLSREELLQQVRIVYSGMKRKPKRNSRLTVYTVIGA